MKYYAAVNDEYLGKSIKDGSLAIFEEKEDAERVCNKMDYDLIEVSVVKHETYNRLTEENAKLRHELANLIYMAENNTGNEPSLSCLHLAIDEAKQLLLNQLRDQNNDK